MESLLIRSTNWMGTSVSLSLQTFYSEERDLSDVEKKEVSTCTENFEMSSL